MNADDILVPQRAPRRRFLEGPQAVRWRPARELMARLLLYVHDPQACWCPTTSWLRETLDADLVDGGYGDTELGISSTARLVHLLNEHIGSRSLARQD